MFVREAVTGDLGSIARIYAEKNRGSIGLESSSKDLHLAECRRLEGFYVMESLNSYDGLMFGVLRLREGNVGGPVGVIHLSGAAVSANALGRVRVSDVFGSVFDLIGDDKELSLDMRSEYRSSIGFYIELGAEVVSGGNFSFDRSHGYGLVRLQLKGEEFRKAACSLSV